MANKTKKNRLYIYDGLKASLLWDEATDAWKYISNAPGGEQTESKDYYKAIPTIFRGVNMIANAVSKMPFTITGKGGKEVDNSQDYQNKIGFLPSPRRIFSLASLSLDLTGKSYFRRAGNVAGIMKELVYMVPTSIEPVFDEQAGALTGFKRTLNAGSVDMKKEELVYFWLPDPFIELGPPTAYPVKAALLAAGVLKNLDTFVALYFERGAVRPVIVSAKGVPQEAERERMETWFTKLMGGIKGAFSWKVFNAETVSIEQVGDGLESLRDVELTASAREDVALALNIPYTKLFSRSAGGLGGGGVVEQDDLTFYDETITPRCEFLAEVLNDQLMKGAGYKLEFQPESLGIYQQDEQELSQALTAYTGAGFSLLMACDILGIELTEEQRAQLEKEAAEKEARQQQMEKLRNQAPAPEEEENNPQFQQRGKDKDEAMAEGKRWRRVCLESLRKGKPLPIDWNPEFMPAAMAAAISGALIECKTADDVKAVFANSWMGYP